MHPRFHRFHAAIALALASTAQGQDLQIQSGLVRFRFPGTTAEPLQVESCEDLMSWDLVTAPVTAAGGGLMQISEPVEAARKRRFYRVLRGNDITVPRAVRTLVPRYGYGRGASGDPATNVFPESVLAPLNDPAFGAPWSPADEIPTAQLPSVLSAGLAAWRRQGNHGSCAGCHAPDAFDLARIAYTDADITRRALDHVTSAEAAEIVQFIKAQRQTHRMTRLLHPLNFRPLQPGHTPLPGNNHEARDLAFGQQLANDTKLIWATQRIESRAQAIAAQAQLLALDLRQLRTGIVFDRWSEDHARGAAHRSASEWIPMMAVKPKAGHVQQWHGIQDAYVANPTDAAFWTLYDNIDLMLEPVEQPGFARGQEWSLLKYKSVQLMQHMMRHQSLAMPAGLSGTTGGLVANRLKAITRNPLFRTGDHVRRFPLQFDAANQSTLFPPHLAPSLPVSQTELRDQNENFFRVWFWMGWAQDPALLLSDSIFQTTEGDYLYASLLARYKLHHAFVVAMTSVHKANAADFLRAAGEGVAGHGKWAAHNPFMVLHHIERNRNEPPASSSLRALHDRMFSNTARLWIYLVQEDLERTGTVHSRELVRGCIGFCRAWLDDTEPGVNHAALDAVIADINTRLNAATELRTDFTNDDLPGGLPFN